MRLLGCITLVTLLLSVSACSDSEPANGAPTYALPSDEVTDVYAQDSVASDSSVPTTDVDTEDVPPETAGDTTQDDTTEMMDTPSDAPTETDSDAPMDSMEDTLDPPVEDVAPGDTVEADSGASDPDVALDAAIDGPMDAPLEDAGPQPDFDQILTVGEASNAELYAMAVLESGLVVVLWRSGEDDVLLSPIDPWTSTVSEPILIEAGAGNGMISKGGDVVANGETVAVTWWSKNMSDDPDPLAGETIRFKTGTLDALSGPSVLLASEANEALWRPHLVSDSGSTMCALWQHGWAVHMRCSVDAGASFSDTSELKPNGIKATLSTGAFLNNGDLVVAYQGATGNKQSVYIVQTSDLGLSWSAPIDVGATSGVGQAIGPTMAPGMAGQIHLAWYNTYQGTNSAWHTTSSDGSAWSAPQVLPTVQSWIALKPGRAENLHLSGQDNIPGYGTAHYMTSADDGQSWGAAKAIPVASGAEPQLQFNAELEANLVEGWLHLAWWEGDATEQSLSFVTVEP